MNAKPLMNRRNLLVFSSLLLLPGLLSSCQRLPMAELITPTFPYPLVSTVSHASSPTQEPSTTSLPRSTQTIAVTLPPEWTPTVFASSTMTPTATLPSFPIVRSTSQRTSLPTISEALDQSIAFVSASTGVKHIFTMTEDGSNLMQLTNGEFYDTYPTWSHDGEMIAFLRAEEEHPRSLQRSNVILMDIDGGNQKNLTPTLDMELASIAWAPDDKAIAFDASLLPGDHVFSGSNIYVVNIRNLVSTQISDTSSSNVGCSMPSWSPDGAHLIFTCRALMNAGVVLGRSDRLDTFYIDFVGQPDRAIWLPSGDTIAVRGGMGCMLATLDPDYMLQKGEIDFGFPPCFDQELLALGYEHMSVSAVHWSPTVDSRFILQSPSLILIIDLEHGEIIRVVGDFGGVEGHVSWGPNEEKVVFTYNDGSDFEIAVIDLRTMEIIQLTDNDVDDLMPAWGPSNRD